MVDPNVILESIEKVGSLIVLQFAFICFFCLMIGFLIVIYRNE